MKKNKNIVNWVIGVVYTAIGLFGLVVFGFCVADFSAELNKIQEFWVRVLFLLLFLGDLILGLYSLKNRYNDPYAPKQ